MLSAQLGIAGAEEGEVPAIDPAAANAPGAGGEGDAYAQARRVPTMGKQVLSDLLEKEAQAAREGDIIMVTCLRAKLRLLRKLQEQAQARLASLESAGAGDGSADTRAAEGADEPYALGRMNTHAVVLLVLGEKIKQLAAEADRCLGGDVFATPELRVRRNVDDSLVPEDDDPSEPPALVDDVPLQDISPQDIEVDIDPVIPGEASPAF